MRRDDVKHGILSRLLPLAEPGVKPCRAWAVTHSVRTSAVR
ncbi:hypothetical protein AKJ09_02865 [Labilithrix luteola]|uniref:Uncharacterized protein n=1 Tax=Labilithrix luteola TaxID=1391654 RepID=A0A0K1PS44_9BACT|nr:hypothetical protein AKJ09_02865 [Labilithrix luteola]